MLCVEGGWSGDLMIADYEDLQGSEAAEIYVESFKSQAVFVTGECEFPCTHGSPRLPGRPRPPSTAEGNLEREDVEIEEEGDKKGSTREDSWSTCGSYLWTS